MPVSLNTGLLMPRIGFGTWKLDGQKAEKATTMALDVGYRLIDTASIYMNEEMVGNAIRLSDVPRGEIMITTKVWKSEMGLASTKLAYENSLKKLGVDYVDLYLIHWPSGGDWQEAWNEMEKLYRQGRVRNIGVSNFRVENLRQLKESSHLVPAINQIELHPFNYKKQKPIIDYCNQEGIVIQAYSPLSQTAWLDNQVLTDIAKVHEKTPAQIMLRWSIQLGAVPIPKASTKAHMLENFQVFEFELTEQEMYLLNDLSPEKSVITAKRHGGWYAKTLFKRKLSKL